MLRLARLLRGGFAAVALALLPLSVISYQHAQAYRTEELAQGRRLLCGDIYNRALFCFLVGSGCAVVAVAMHRETRALSQIV